MKTHKIILALLVVASAFLPSCMLLDSSPLHSPRPRPFLAPHKPRPYRPDYSSYNKSFEVPVEGGIYEIDCANDQFYISKVFDSSMSEPLRLSDGHYSPAERDFITVNDLTYTGQFYTITCNVDKHNCVIEIEPLSAAPDESDYRELRVFMWDGSDDSHFVFRFEQIDDYDYGYIE